MSAQKIRHSDACGSVFELTMNLLIVLAVRQSTRKSHGEFVESREALAEGTELRLAQFIEQAYVGIHIVATSAKSIASSSTRGSDGLKKHSLKIPSGVVACNRRARISTHVRCLFNASVNMPRRKQCVNKARKAKLIIQAISNRCGHGIELESLGY